MQQLAASQLYDTACMTTATVQAQSLKKGWATVLLKEMNDSVFV